MVYTFLLSPDVHLWALARKKKDDDDAIEPRERKARTHTHTGSSSSFPNTIKKYRIDRLVDILFSFAYPTGGGHPSRMKANSHLLALFCPVSTGQNSGPVKDLGRRRPSLDESFIYSYVVFKFTTVLKRETKKLEKPASQPAAASISFE